MSCTLKQSTHHLAQAVAALVSCIAPWDETLTTNFPPGLNPQGCVQTHEKQELLVPHGILLRGQ